MFFSSIVSSLFADPVLKPIIALSFVLIVYTIGDIISVKTKSIVSMMFTCSVLFLIGFWSGVPVDLFASSQLFAIGALLITMLLTHMGTMLNFQQLVQQWRTVLIALAAIVGIVVLLLTVGSLVMDRNAALIAAPPIAGGVIAGIQMAEAAAKIGNDSYVVLATLLVVVQGFIGYPVASFCLRKEAAAILKRKGALSSPEAVAAPTPAAEKPAFLAKFKSDNILLAKTAIIALLATVISYAAQKAAGFNVLDKNILALLFGVLAAETGLLERGVLSKANSFGLAMAALMAVIFNNLSKATPEIVINLLPVIVKALAIGAIGIVIFSFLAAKLLKVSPYIAIAIGASALFGFPGTYIISHEVSNTASDDPQEQKLVLDQILPRMLVAGFITVSIASVVLAGLLSPMVR